MVSGSLFTYIVQHHHRSLLLTNKWEDSLAIWKNQNVADYSPSPDPSSTSRTYTHDEQIYLRVSTSIPNTSQVFLCLKFSMCNFFLLASYAVGLLAFFKLLGIIHFMWTLLLCLLMFSYLLKNQEPQSNPSPSPWCIGRYTMCCKGGNVRFIFDSFMWTVIIIYVCIDCCIIALYFIIRCEEESVS